MMQDKSPIIDVKGLETRFGKQLVHQHLDLTVYPGEIIAIIGESGCGKTTLLRALLMLMKPTAGSVELFGYDVWRCSSKEKELVRHRWGVMFQSGALFSSLTVLQNIMLPIEEGAQLYPGFGREIALVKLLMVGLPLSAASKYPSELSGGMLKRVALARALALDPELIFLDEPSAGLDPRSAAELDKLLLSLREQLGITLMVITHDLDTLWTIPDRVVFMGDQRVLAALPMEQLVLEPHPSIQAYFSNGRAKRYTRTAKGDING